MCLDQIGQALCPGRIIIKARNITEGLAASLSDRLALPLHCIGHILPAGSGLQLQTTDGRPVPTACAGYDHFR